MLVYYLPIIAYEVICVEGYKIHDGEEARAILSWSRKQNTMSVSCWVELLQTESSREFNLDRRTR